jgi:hypothetical protein
VAEQIKKRSEGMRVRYTIGDTSMWAEHEGPSIAERIEACGIGLIEADKQRIAGWVAVHDWLKSTVDDGTGLRPRMRFYRAGCPTAIRTIPEMVVDPKDPQDMVTVGVEDDSADCLRYFCQDRGGASREPKRSNPEVQWIWNEINRRNRQDSRMAPAVLRGV